MMRPTPSRGQYSRVVGRNVTITNRRQLPQKPRQAVVAANSPRELVPSLDGTTVSVTMGYVNNMIPEIGGTAINAATPPTLTLTGATTLWLLIDWTVTLTGTAPNKTIESVVAENARFELATSQTEVMPSTDGTTATDGLQAVRWADFVSDGGSGYLMSDGWRYGTNQVTYCEGVQQYIMRFERVQG